MSRTELQLSDSQAAEKQAQTVYELGRAHASEWLKTPSSKHLALLRMEFQEGLIKSCEWEVEFQEGLTNFCERGVDNEAYPHAISVAMLELLAIYNAGIDEVVHDFVMLVKAEPRGALQ